jgi:hypothetical protein
MALTDLPDVALDRGPPGSPHQLLVAAAAARLAVPRMSVPADRYSFVLHAPLELFARAALLPLVTPEAHVRARARLGSLVGVYEQLPPLPSPSEMPFESVQHAAHLLVDAIAAQDVDTVDAAAGWLDAHAAPADIARYLGPTALPSLAAAGHANIYLWLRARSMVLPGSDQMLRPLARALGSEAVRPIRVPPTTVVADHDGLVRGRLIEALASVEPVGEPDAPFIATLVHHAQDHGAFDALIGADGNFTTPERVPVEVLRFAAQAMLQGSPEQAPYGWTHCLTLAQAALNVGQLMSGTGPGTFVAAAYLAAHWAAYGFGRLDQSFTPARTTLRLEAALAASPNAAASAAWHGDDPLSTACTLATAASVNHDAHRVKYTLACLHAAEADPGAHRLYLAAAAFLNAWWSTHPDPSDPLPELGG